MKNKKLLAALILAMVAILCFSNVSLFAASGEDTAAGATVSVYDGTPDTSWFQADVKEYTLTTAAQFAGLATVCQNNGALEGYTIRLGCDMVFNSGKASEWSASNKPAYSYTPIPRFDGTLDGCGHIISGLYYNSNQGDVGLISKSAQGVIKNLGIVNSKFATTGSRCGSLIGAVIKESAGITIENVYSDALISANNQVGGLVGIGADKSNIKFTKCVFAGSATAMRITDKTGLYSGGMTGEDGGANAVFTDCINLGSIQAQGNRAGGMAGQLRAASKTLSRCVNSGKISGSIGGAMVGRVATKLQTVDCVYIREYGETPQGDFVGGSCSETNKVVYDRRQIKGQCLFEANGWVAMKDGCPMPSQTVADLAVKADILYNGATKADEWGLSTLWGASMRTASPSGLRFETRISKTAYNSLVETYGADKVKMGTVIVPAVYVLEAESFTKASLEKLPKEGTKYLDVQADQFFRETENDFVFSASVVDILEENRELAFAAIGYIEINGEIHYSRTIAQRSVSEVAIAALKDTVAEQTAEYAYPMTVNGQTVYSYLTPEERATINSFAVWGDDSYGSQIEWN